MAEVVSYRDLRVLMVTSDVRKRLHLDSFSAAWNAGVLVGKVDDLSVVQGQLTPMGRSSGRGGEPRPQVVLPLCNGGKASWT